MTEYAKDVEAMLVAFESRMKDTMSFNERDAGLVLAGYEGGLHAGVRYSQDGITGAIHMINTGGRD